MQSIVHQHNTSHPSPFFPIWWRTPPALFELRVAQFFISDWFSTLVSHRTGLGL